MKSRRLTSQQVVDFLHEIRMSDSITFEFDVKKQLILGCCNYVKMFELKLPLPFSIIKDNETIEKYFNRISTSFPPFIILLIQADYCVLGYFENGDVVLHKTLRTYMTRKKSGKNQLTHLSKGGKGGTSGGQLRYQNAIHFFEKINETLNEWSKMIHPVHIFYSCPIKMWQYLFNSKVKCYFDRKDVRLRKIPLNVSVANFEEMTCVYKKISSGYLTFYEESMKCQ